MSVSIWYTDRMKAIVASISVLFILAYLAIWCLVVGAIGYVAYEILFNSALDRWFS